MSAASTPCVVLVEVAHPRGTHDVVAGFPGTVHAEPLFGGRIEKTRLTLVLDVPSDVADSEELFSTEVPLPRAVTIEVERRLSDFGRSREAELWRDGIPALFRAGSPLHLTSLAWTPVADLGDRPADEAWRWIRRPHDCMARAVPVAYGLPGPDMVAEAEAGRIVLGGCVLGGPENQCRTCGHEW